MVTKDSFLPFLLAVTALLTVAFPPLAQSGLLGGQAITSRGDDTLITPAGYAFAVWGVIYTGLLVFAVFQALPTQLTNPRFKAARPWVLLNCLFNMAWLYFAVNGYLRWTGLLIFGLLGTLLLILDALRVGRQPVGRAEAYLARFPFAVYTGWVTVATFANTSAYLRSVGFTAPVLGEVGWTVAMLIAGFGVGVYLFMRYRNPAYLLTIVWALVAIAVRQPQAEWVRLTAGAGVVALVVMLVRFLRLHQRQHPA